MRYVYIVRPYRMNSWMTARRFAQASSRTVCRRFDRKRVARHSAGSWLVWTGTRCKCTQAWRDSPRGPRLRPYHRPCTCDRIVAGLVFGNRLGKRVTSIRTAWENAREAAGLKGFQLRDLRHEAASRFEEAGVLTTDVSKFLGHRNLSTTTRYLNTTSRRLRLALLRVEQARAQSESLADSCKETPDSLPHADAAEASSTPSTSLSS